MIERRVATIRATALLRRHRDRLENQESAVKGDATHPANYVRLCTKGAVRIC